MKSINKVFNDINLRKLIFDYLKNISCISCRKNIFFTPFNI